MYSLARRAIRLKGGKIAGFNYEAKKVILSKYRYENYNNFDLRVQF